MRLAVVTPFVDRQHGTERALAELLDRLSRDYRCEIHLYAERVEDLTVTPSTQSQRPVILSRPQDGEGSQPSPYRPTQNSALAQPPIAAAPTPGSITWHPVPTIPGPHLFKFLFWLIANSTIRCWHRIAGRLRFDLVLSPGINCLDADFIIVHAVFRRLRELAQEQPQQLFVPGTRSSTPRRLHRGAYYATVAALERIVYSNRKTKLAAVSQRTADLLALCFGRKDVPVIFNGIDTVQFSVPARLARRQGARFRRKLSDDELVLLLIGNDWRMKGLPAILESLKAASDLPLRLIVAGSDVPANFEGIVEHLRVGNRCLWESTRPDVIDFYAAADVYVSPSREDSFGLPVAEAMACGLPVITSKFAGVSERIQNECDGFILPDPMNVPALTSLIRRLHADPALRARIGQAASATTQSWTWDRNASETWNWLQSGKPTRSAVRD
ncbi:MAG: glycosyltransferase family 4 protein [Acidobacteria bacterium]|nr:glycosyltransferase family 4 protein [Acidobacteriota bacterium]